MRIFLDTGSLEEIKSAARFGVISGVTTNPSLMAKEGCADFRDYRQAVQEICSIIHGPISAEVLSNNVEGMIAEAREVAAWGPQVVVKLPSTPAGIESMSRLSKEGVRINQTLCFSVNQALLGAIAGATFVSPFVGRLDDEGHDGMQVVADIAQMFRQYKFATQVLAASIRHPLHVIAAAKAGADIATVPYKVFMQMFHHPLTDVGVARFNEDWQRAVKV